MHTFYWGDYHRDSVLGPERAPDISPTGWVLERGMMFGSHHDAPVALPNSMRILSATVTRKTRTGKVLGPEHKVDVATALKALTIWPAWQHFEEDSKGSIEVGKLADFVVLSDNPLTIDEDLLDDLVILETIKEDVSIYKRPAKADDASVPTPAKFGITLDHPRNLICNRTANRAVGPLGQSLSFDPQGFDPLPSVINNNYGIKPICGDGCFNHGLSMMLRAIEMASEER